MIRTAFFLILIVGAHSKLATAQTSDRGWVDVSFVSASPLEKGATYTYRYTLFQETASLVAAYPELPRASGVLVGGGARILGGLGVGVLYTALKYEYTVGLGISIPHPTLFNRVATDTDVTASTLERSDDALDISVAYQPPTPDTWRLRVFGGPTFFSFKQGFVQDIRYSQQSNPQVNSVDITGFTEESASQTTWGFHAGADVAYFFSRYWGVGAGLRFNRGTVKLLSEPLSESRADLRVGSAVIGGGLRVRF